MCSGMARTKPTTATTIAPKNAGQNPVTWNGSPSWCDSHDANQNSRAFTTKPIRPKVSTYSTQPATLTNGLTTALTSPNTTATPTSVPTWAGVDAASRLMPGRKVATQTAIAVASTR